MRHLLISVAAAITIAGAATIATAQDDKGKGPGSDQQAPGAGKAEKPDPKSMREEPGSTPQQAPPKGAQQSQPDADKQKSTQQQQDTAKDKSKAAKQPQTGPDKQKSTQQQQEPAKDRPKATQQPQTGTDKQKSTKDSKDQPKAAQEPGKDRPASAEQQGKDKAGSRVQVSEEQRTNVRERLVKETRVEKTRINVSVNIGTAIPRSVRLHTLPVAIVAIAPAYRGYSYVLLEDETIVIVDPRTYVVVDAIVVDARRAERPAGRAQLTLSPEDRRYIYTTLPKDRAADVRVRLALGAEVPRNVELLTFPAEVATRVRAVERYRYIVSGTDIAIVDPSDFSVVLVINE
jgi:hypothetical protein